MKKMSLFLLICCLVPLCVGCKERKGRTRRHEPQSVMLRDKPAPRPAEVKQVPQPTPQNQRTETLSSFSPPPQRASQPAQMAPADSIGEPVPYVKSEPGIQYIQEGELAK